MLRLRTPERTRILGAIARAGARYGLRRIVVITASLAVLLAVPLLGLARVDVWRGRHLLLGHPATAVQALQGVVVTLAVLYGLTFLTNTALGRFFCGWGCPVGFVGRLGEDVELRRGPALRRWVAHAAGAGFVATFVAAGMLWWVDARVVVDGSPAARAIAVGTFAVLCLGGTLHAWVWRFAFCRSACPVGLYYRYVTSTPPVGIVFAEDPDPCIQCGACTRVCPVGLEPRALGPGAAPQGPPGEPDRWGDAECLRCGDCVEACRMVFLKRPGARPPLRFGAHAPRTPGNADPAGPGSRKLDGGDGPRRDSPGARGLHGR